MDNNMICFLVGIGVGTFVLEPIIINLVYFTNIDLFLDIIIWKKNRIKLRHYFLKDLFGKGVNKWENM